MNIRLCSMTIALNRRFFSNFEYDPDIFVDPSRLTVYTYDQEKADAYWQRQKHLGRIRLAIIGDDDPISEIVLKNIDCVNKFCTMGIHMQNDSVKNKGYGTIAEMLVIQYAFNELGMETILADALKKNTRSQHVLKRAGFREIGQDDTFYYYRCDRSNGYAQKESIP